MYLIVKRTFDVVTAGIALVLISPLLLVIALILRFTGEGEIFFRHVRVGFGNRPFGVWKFATMQKGSENTGTITVAGDPRVLPFGKLLRKTKLNELPQLWNVVVGEMSVVGPRPLAAEGFEMYPNDLKPWVYRSKPGLTGIGSVVFRNEEGLIARSGKAPKDCYREDIAPLKGALEVWYHRNRSFRLDLLLVFLTVVAVLRPDGDFALRCLARVMKDELPPALAARLAVGRRAVDGTLAAGPLDR